MQVDVPADEDGALRDYMSSGAVGRFIAPSAAARIAGAGPPRFGIDYGINLDDIDHISASDILAGNIDPGRVRGRDILVGATAQELRDLFLTPRYGVIAGVNVHALAAETLRQRLALRDWPFALAAVVIFALALFASLISAQGSRPAGLMFTLMACGALELFAVALQHFFKMRAETAGGLIALLGFFIVGILADVRLRRQLHAQAARERDAMGAMLSRVVEDNFDGVVIVDGLGAIVAASRFAQDLLGAVVERLRESGMSMVTRLGGDSFVCALDEALDPETLALFGQSLADRLGEPYEIRACKIIIGASVGGTTTTITGTNADALISHASIAQATAKRRIGDVFHVFSPEMEKLRRDKQSIDRELRHSISDGSLALLYQPKVDLTSGRLVGAEALMRWRDTSGAAVSPAKFIPIAEESGLIVELGRWALIRGCEEATKWPEPYRIAINVSPVQFALGDVVAEVAKALEISGLRPGRLEIEITESLFVDNQSRVSESLDRLRALGVTVALDDFGTGYSSLHYLGALPIDTIKIDQSFTRRLLADPAADATVLAIVSLARAHNKHLVAEGIETVEQADLLRQFGCDVAQGYLYGRPETANVFRERFNELQTCAA